MKNQKIKMLECEKYDKCNHILVYTGVEETCYMGILEQTGEGIKYGTMGLEAKHCGCIKCGLNTEFLEKKPRYYEETLMHDYLEENPNLNGIQTNYACDLELAQTIYSRIKEVLPDINDETARKYFEIALDNYILYRYDNKIKNQKRKRLGLRPTFNR